MRIGVLHNSGPGGALRFVEQTARHLAETDDVVVATWGDDPDPPMAGVSQAWWPAPRIVLPPPLHPFGDLARSFFGSARAARRAELAGFDVVLAYACRWAQTPELLRRLRIPAVYYAQEGRRRSLERGYLPASAKRQPLAEHVWDVGRMVYDAIGARLDRRAMQGATHVLTNSAFTARNLAAAYDVEATVVEAGVDVSRFRPGERVHEPAVLFVGALDPTKGAHLVVQALGRLPACRRPSLRLVYSRVNDAYVRELGELARDAGVHVVHRRAIPDEDLVDEYRSALLVAAAAMAEPYGLTVPEASATGTPTVAVREGGFVETVVEGINGVLVPRTAEGLAAGIDEVLTGAVRFDRDAMAAWARERWSWQRCSASIRDACQRAIEDFRP